MNIIIDVYEMPYNELFELIIPGTNIQLPHAQLLYSFIDHVSILSFF